LIVHGTPVTARSLVGRDMMSRTNETAERYLGFAIL